MSFSQPRTLRSTQGQVQEQDELQNQASPELVHGSSIDYQERRKRLRRLPPSPSPALNPFNAPTVNALEGMFARVMAIASGTPLPSKSPTRSQALSGQIKPQEQDTIASLHPSSSIVKPQADHRLSTTFSIWPSISNMEGAKVSTSSSSYRYMLPPPNTNIGLNERKQMSPAPLPKQMDAVQCNDARIHKLTALQHCQESAYPIASQVEQGDTQSFDDGEAVDEGSVVELLSSGGEEDTKEEDDDDYDDDDKSVDGYSDAELEDDYNELAASASDAEHDCLSADSIVTLDDSDDEQDIEDKDQNYEDVGQDYDEEQNNEDKEQDYAVERQGFDTEGTEIQQYHRLDELGRREGRSDSDWGEGPGRGDAVGAEVDEDDREETEDLLRRQRNAQNHMWRRTMGFSSPHQHGIALRQPVYQGLSHSEGEDQEEEDQKEEEDQDEEVAEEAESEAENNSNELSSQDPGIKLSSSDPKAGGSDGTDREVSPASLELSDDSVVLLLDSDDDSEGLGDQEIDNDAEEDDLEMESEESQQDGEHGMEAQESAAGFWSYQSEVDADHSSMSDVGGELPVSTLVDAERETGSVEPAVDLMSGLRTPRGDELTATGHVVYDMDVMLDVNAPIAFEINRTLGEPGDNVQLFERQTQQQDLQGVSQLLSNFSTENTVAATGLQFAPDSFSNAATGGNHGQAATIIVQQESSQHPAIEALPVSFESLPHSAQSQLPQQQLETASSSNFDVNSIHVRPAVPVSIRSDSALRSELSSHHLSLLEQLRAVAQEENTKLLTNEPDPKLQPAEASNPFVVNFPPMDLSKTQENSLKPTSPRPLHPTVIANSVQELAELLPSLPRKTRLVRQSTISQTVREGKAYLDMIEAKLSPSSKILQQGQQYQPLVIPPDDTLAMEDVLLSPSASSAASELESTTSNSRHRGEVRLLVQEARAFCSGVPGPARIGITPTSSALSATQPSSPSHHPLTVSTINSLSPRSQTQDSSPSRVLFRQRISLDGAEDPSSSGHPDNPALTSSAPSTPSTSSSASGWRSRSGVVDLAAENVFLSTVIGNHALRPFINSPSPVGMGSGGTGGSSGSRSNSLEPHAAFPGGIFLPAQQQDATTNPSPFSFGQTAFGSVYSAPSNSSPSSARASPSVGFEFGTSFIVAAREQLSPTSPLAKRSAAAASSVLSHGLEGRVEDLNDNEEEDQDVAVDDEDNEKQQDQEIDYYPTSGDTSLSATPTASIQSSGGIMVRAPKRKRSQSKTRSKNMKRREAAKIQKQQQQQQNKDY
ncbi:hypothetical protein EDD11_008807 [Mortierella claussenii]|nr:hypothetical protein EDD11_008807 [Mortierella claussenii]